MNFDFLKNARELRYLYENCSNAEKLAMTMPMQSVFTSRKSAELLAKLIYMAAHNQEMEDLSFADILADRSVRDFIHSRDIMDAFHFIRKNGNRAAHADTQWDVEDALDVLQDLHYVTGETACMLGLIRDYPQFNDSIGVYPDACYNDDELITEKAREMFCAYLEEYNAQAEREKYIEPSTSELCTYSISGDIVMHEHLCFEHMPKQKAVTEYVTKYLENFVRLTIEHSSGSNPDISHPVVFRCTLSLAGGETYSTDATDDFLDAITNKLPIANGFIIDITCKGIVRELFTLFDEDGIGDVNLLEKDALWNGAGMLDQMEYYKRRERFIYKLAIFYPNSGEYKYEKIANGRTVDIDALMTPDFALNITPNAWSVDSLDLIANFDFEEHSDILNKLHNIVRESVPKSQLAFCEDGWEDGDPGLLLNSICWNTYTFEEIQQFLDDINSVLNPIADTVDAESYGYWENPSMFALAKCRWTGTKFELVGTFY